MNLNKYAKKAIVLNIMADVPKVDINAFRKQIEADVHKLMTPAVRKVYKETPQALEKLYVSELYDSQSWDTRHVITGNVTEAQLREICKPLKAAVEARQAIYNKLSGVMESVRTLAALKKLLPEFAAYFPTEDEPTKNLPAVANLVTDMVKLGWPTDKRKLKVTK